ncbi:XyeB family radical SAM/SPASM peptide maturase [Alphaproteobacteria bacterium]|nr:XyeB family radical SAM/SPASM peptide maturase [Alphaproteobacteria bacterium]
MNANNLSIIFKISEGCPLACDYCYYFRNVVNPHKSRPIKMEEDVTQKLCERIMELNEKDKDIACTFFFHGGEPLFIGKDKFLKICDMIADTLKVPYSFLVQTNGALIDKEWIEIFKKYNIVVGISIDGPEEYQNVHRKLKNGEGSFDIVDKNIRMCVTEKLNLGVLIVADPSFDPQKIWNYLVGDVGVKYMDILLRDYTYDTIPSREYVDAVSDYLAKWIGIWFAKDNEAVRVRIFDSIVNVLLGRTSLLEFSFDKDDNNYPTITVFTNGDVSPMDDLTSVSGNLMDIDKNIFKNSLEDIFDTKVFKELSEARQNIPKDCTECCWRYVCRGGGCICGRFSSQNRFSNKSVYCKAWSSLFSVAALRLLKHGHPKEKLLKVLAGENECACLNV